MTRLGPCATALLILAGTALAEPKGYDLPALMAVCAEGKCENATQSVVNRLEAQALSEEEMNEQLSYVALALFEVAKADDDPETRARVAAAMEELAEHSTDPVQQAAMQDVSQAIADGDADIWDVDDPFSASPT